MLVAHAKIAVLKAGAKGNCISREICNALLT